MLSHIHSYRIFIPNVYSFLSYIHFYRIFIPNVYSFLSYIHSYRIFIPILLLQVHLLDRLSSFTRIKSHVSPDFKPPTFPVECVTFLASCP